MSAIKGLYAITPDEQDTDILLAKVEAALQGGIGILQYRNKLADHKLKT
ncbi:MAG: thiamine phosphate synthase, partial [Methylotenera sp.]